MGVSPVSVLYLGRLAVEAWQKMSDCVPLDDRVSVETRQGIASVLELSCLLCSSSVLKVSEPRAAPVSIS